MSTYSFEAINPSGKTVKGSLEADTRDKAAAELKSAGNTILRLEEAGILSRDIELSVLDPGPKPRDMAVFCRQFVSIIDAGVPVVTALEMLGEQTENKKLRRAIVECRKTIEHGESLADAMSDHPKVFPKMFVTLVEAGEASGSLDVSFTRMAEQFEKSAKLKATVTKALIYPSVILFIAVLAMSVLLAFVVPTFENMLLELGTGLPGITKAVIAASNFLQNRWYVVIAAVIGLVIAIRTYKKTDSGQRFFGTLAVKNFVTRKLVVKTASARMARTLSTLLGSGIPIMEALAITASTMTNICFKEELLRARDQVLVGAPLAKQFREGGLFPPMVHQMITIGENSGDIDNMLTKLAEYYEDEVEQATQQLLALLEPIIILVLAAGIGTIIVAVLYPLATMYGGLNNL